MVSWALALSVGVVAAVVQYGRPNLRALPAAVLRALTVAALVALWTDAPVGAGRGVRPLAALDVSASWLRGGDTAAYRKAVSEVERSGADTVFLFGDSTRIARIPDLPADRRSRVRGVVERALAAGRPLVLVTDGELDDPESVAELPTGSRVIVIPHSTKPDGAVASLDAPRAAVAGDTIEVHATIASGTGGAPPGSLTIGFSGSGAGNGATTDIALLPAGVNRTVEARLVVPAGDGAREIRAVWSAPGDADPRNDTVSVPIDVSPAAGAVFVSSSPDEDARYALAVLRGALALPTRGFYRVAPGQWRIDGSLSPVADAEVRHAARLAPLVVIHGDTTVLGAPLAATTGALALIVPTPPSPSQSGREAAADEWFVTSALPSPIASSLSGVRWDSLPPIELSTGAAAGFWPALELKRGRRLDRRVAVFGGSLGGRRAVIVGVSGLWRWGFRGGAAADAFAAFWGAVFDWLAAERRDSRAALPVEALLREGESLHWRRGDGAAPPNS